MVDVFKESAVLMDKKLLTRSALLLALTLVFQSLRFIIPLPMVFSTLLIGSLVNSCLLVAVETIGLSSACIIAIIASIVAYFQQLLPLPLFIGPVAAGNIIYLGVFYLLLRQGRWLAVGLAAICKAGFLYGSFTWLLTLIAIPAKLAAGLMFAMSWPQLVTGILGGLLAANVSKRIKLL